MRGIGIAAGCKPVASALLVRVQVDPPYTFLAQMAEQRIFNPKVAGSSPAERTTRTDGGMEDAPG